MTMKFDSRSLAHSPKKRTKLPPRRSGQPKNPCAGSAPTRATSAVQPVRKLRLPAYVRHS